MPEWLREIISRVKESWGRWAASRKILFIGIVVVAAGSFILLGTLSSRPSMVPILGVVIEDMATADRIAVALDTEGISYTRGSDNRFYAADEPAARMARGLLVREDLIPGGMDPWALFDTERWTLTDFERDVNLRRALTLNLEKHIAALKDVDSAQVTLVMPETTLFAEDQNPVTASVVLMPKPGSDIIENRKKIGGIVKLIQFAVEGLLEENITILDYSGNILNDFMGLEDVDRLEITKRMLRQKRALEAQYTATILQSLQNVFTPERVDIVNLDIDLEFVQKSIQTEEHFPIVMKEDDPKTPYSELEVKPSITISRNTQSEKFEGTGFNPEGPPGQEGQTPPAYQDLTNLVGQYNSNNQTENEVVNTRSINEEKSPYVINKISAAVALDGNWKLSFDEAGEPVVEVGGSRKRDYIPVEEDLLKKAQSLVEHAVGYSPARGDMVRVENLPFDRSGQFQMEDDAWYRKQQVQRILIYSIFGILGLIVLFVVVRVINRQMEKRRRLREEELARQHQAMREQALRNAEEEAMDVEMSVQERTRIEMQENAKNIAREHPEDVAQLLRTWLIEE